jgi:hypothetical protein
MNLADGFFRFFISSHANANRVQASSGLLSKQIIFHRLNPEQLVTAAARVVGRADLSFLFF